MHGFVVLHTVMGAMFFAILALPLDIGLIVNDLSIARSSVWCAH
jgi:hypothetical protein